MNKFIILNLFLMTVVVGTLAGGNGTMYENCNGKPEVCLEFFEGDLPQTASTCADKTEKNAVNGLQHICTFNGVNSETFDATSTMAPAEAEIKNCKKIMDKSDTCYKVCMSGKNKIYIYLGTPLCKSNQVAYRCKEPDTKTKYCGCSQFTDARNMEGKKDGDTCKPN